MDQLQTARPEEEQRAIIQLSNAAVAWDDVPSLEAIWRSAQHNPLMFEEFRWLLKGYDIQSAEASNMREFYRHQQEISSRPLLEPSPSERIANLLDRFEQGELDAWWRLNREMTLKPDSTYYGDEFVSNLTKLPVWMAADGETKARIIKAATAYLLSVRDPQTKTWLGKNVPHPPVYAAYRALRLLLNEAPSSLETIPAEVWRKWAPITIGYRHSGGNIEDGADQRKLVEMAYAHAPREVIDSLMTLIDQENKAYKSVLILRHIEGCWDARLADALFSKLSDKKLTSTSMGEILGKLLKHDVAQAREFAKSLLSSPMRSSGKKRQQSLAAAQMLAACAEDAGWSAIWRIIEKDARFGRELAERLVHADRINGRAPLSQRLAEDQLADLFIWLSQQYPHSEDAHPKGAHSVTIREEIGHWRDALPSSIAQRGTVEAVVALRRIMNELPDLAYLEYSLHEAKAMMRRRTWAPVQPEDLLKLVRDRQARLVENADQLLDIVIESLSRLEQEFQGNTAAAGELWNYTKAGHKKVGWRPKDENEFSDRVKRHLERDIKQKGIILNREPEIRPGQELDLHIEALVPSRDDTGSIAEAVSVVVESKGCWHNDLISAMETQLANTYLKGSRCKTGLYLVCWFNCPRWEKQDNRKSDAERLAPDKGELQIRLSDQANKLSRDGLSIKAMVLDVSLR